jgi:hypothetical protein
LDKGSGGQASIASRNADRPIDGLRDSDPDNPRLSVAIGLLKWDWSREIDMPLQLGALRDALIEAGASPEKAGKAAEELAGYENRFDGVENKLAAMDARIGAFEGRVDSRFVEFEGRVDARFAEFEGRMDARFASLEGRVNTLEERLNGRFNLLSWMLGFVLAFELAILWRVFGHG